MQPSAGRQPLAKLQPAGELGGAPSGSQASVGNGVVGDGDGALLGRVVLQAVDVVVARGESGGRPSVVPTGDVVGARVGNVIIGVCVVGGRVGNVIIGARVWGEVVQAWVQGKRKVSQLEM